MVVYLALRTYGFSFGIPAKLLSDSSNCVRFLESINAYIQACLKRSIESVCYHIVLHVTRITGMCKRNYGVLFFQVKIT